MSVAYDAGVLVAADRNDRNVWAAHRVRLELGMAPLTTAPVVAQVSRSGQQAQLRRFLRGCDVLSFSGDQAHRVGSLLRAAGTKDVVDAHLVLVAGLQGAAIHTSDESDLSALAAHAPAPVRIVRV